MKRLLSRPILQLQVPACLLLACLPVAFVSNQLYRVAWDNAWHEVTEKHQLLATTLTAPITSYVEDHRKLLSFLGHQIENRLDSGASVRDAEPLLRDAFSELSKFSSVLLLDPNGDTLSFASPTPSTGTLPNDLGNEPCFVRTVDQLTPQLSSVRLGPYSGRPSIMMSYPVLSEDGSLRAVLLGELGLQRLEMLRRSVQFGEFGHSAILDNKGRVVAHPNPMWTDAIRDLSSISVVKKALAGNTGTGEFFSPALKQDVIAGYAAIPSLGWAVIVPQPIREIEAQIRGLLQWHYVWTAVAALLAIGLALALARWITRPINKLVDQANSFNVARLSDAIPSLPDTSPREIKQLGSAVNELVDRWQRREASTAKKTRTLEQHIRRRTSDLRKAHRQLTTLARRDHLTTLFNRRHFEARVSQSISQIANTESTHGLLYIDLDRFKGINDNCGYLGGDQLLCRIAKLLKAHTRGQDVVARLSGDVFVVLLVATPGKQACILAERIRRSIARDRFTWRDRRFSVTASIGVVTIDHRSDVSSALQAADASCSSAKDNGRDRTVYYRADSDQILKRRGESRWMARLNMALDADRFELYAQPIVGLTDPEEPHHYEVLVRLRIGDGKRVRPGYFLPAAERYGLAQRIDRWVVSKTIEFVHQNPTLLPPGGRFFVNLSAQSLVDSSFAQFVCERLQDSPETADRLSFEVTETAAIGNLALAVAVMERIRQAGCQFALDDFGTGMSSFEYLKELPVDMLKIDGSFVERMMRDKDDFAIVQAVNNLGKSMGLVTVAESVADRVTLGRVRELGVDFAQGFAFAPPRPLHSLQASAERLERRRAALEYGYPLH
ncbi:MAG: EAL domain-containing protein [Pseudomonadota bacterium]